MHCQSNVIESIKLRHSRFEDTGLIYIFQKRNGNVLFYSYHNTT